MKRSGFPKVKDGADVRRDHIAQAAAQLIADHGLETVTMRAVASAAGCSRGLVEHYFSNKESLVTAADAWINAQAISRAGRAIANKQGLEALEVRLHHILPFTQTILDEWRVRVVFWRRERTTAMKMRGESIPFEPIFTAIHNDIAAAREAGEIAPSLNPAMMAELVLFTVAGISCFCLSDTRLRSKRSLDERVQMIISTLRTGDLSAFQFSKGDVY